jgi:ribosomal small subunit protein bTHX
MVRAGSSLILTNPTRLKGCSRLFFSHPQFVIYKWFAILAHQIIVIVMGKGDKKSKQGKRWRKSYGVSRNRKAIKVRMKRAASSRKAAKPAEEGATKTKRAKK